MKRKERVRYYHSFDEDFVAAKDQSYRVGEDYQWVRTDRRSRILSALTYAVAFVLSSVGCRIFLRMRFRDRNKLKAVGKTGAFLYANHTQPVGDVFLPALAVVPRRVFVVVSPANLSIPVIGKLLPYLGALPTADSVSGLRKLTQAMEYRLEQKKWIVIYPEAHVWKYYTGIRPFPETAFRFPVKMGKPAYCMTTTYQKRRFGKKPRTVVYLDGPFFADGEGNVRQQTVRLRDQVFACMEQRSRRSNCEYIPYQKI